MRIYGSIGAMVCIATILLLSRGRLRGGTLQAPWAWSCAALSAAVLAAVLEQAATAAQAPWLCAHLEYLAAVATLSPFVALLGAKRPQHRAWQWIVFALMALLALPSLKAMVFDRGAAPDPHAAWRWLISIVAVSGLLNYLPTRQAPSAGLYFCGQAILLADYLPAAAGTHFAQFQWLGLPLMGAAAAAAYWLAGKRSSAANAEDRLWLDFRNAFGALWALRVAERFNAAAVQHDWPVRLSWHGLQPAAPPLGTNAADARQAWPPELRSSVRRTLKSLLLRFVSADWIAERLEAAPDD